MKAILEIELEIDGEILPKVLSMLQAALKEIGNNILSAEPLGEEFQKVLNEVPYDEGGGHE